MAAGGGVYNDTVIKFAPSVNEDPLKKIYIPSATEGASIIQGDIRATLTAGTATLIIKLLDASQNLLDSVSQALNAGTQTVAFSFNVSAYAPQDYFILLFITTSEDVDGYIDIIKVAWW